MSDLSQSNLLKGVNLYLIGMMGSGKTTVGRLLAEQLDYRFFDTDAVIEQATGRSVREIFAESGEPAFRQLETQVLSELSSYTRLVVATGGGIVLDRANWSFLHHGLILWLNVPVETLEARLQADTTRPLLQDPNPTAKLRSLLEQRQALYAQADVQVDCLIQESPAQVVERAIEQIRLTLRPQTTLPNDVN